MKNAVFLLSCWLATLLFCANAVAAGENIQEAGRQDHTLHHQTDWAVKTPPSDSLIYRGLPNLDGAGINGSSMLYPASNVGGLLAGILTHGFVVDKMKQEQQNRLQETADRVWAPYLPALENFGYRELMMRAIAKTTPSIRLNFGQHQSKSESVKEIESSPILMMSQDQLALILDNTIIIQSASQKSETSYQTTLRVISTPRETADPVEHWTGNRGENLKNESAILMALAFEAVLLDMSSSIRQANTPYRTVRYLEGATEKMERGQILARQCSRILLRTLRGTLMSVPASGSSSDTQSTCDK